MPLRSIFNPTWIRASWSHMLAGSAGYAATAFAAAYLLSQAVTGGMALADSGTKYIRSGTLPFGQSGKTVYRAATLDVGDLKRPSLWNPWSLQETTTFRYQTSESGFYPTGPQTELTARFSGDARRPDKMTLASLIEAQSGRELTANLPPGSVARADLEKNQQDMLSVAIATAGVGDVQAGLRAVPPLPEYTVPEYR